MARAAATTLHRFWFRLPAGLGWGRLASLLAKCGLRAGGVKRERVVERWFDTPDLDLLEHGVELRLRTGSDSSTWIALGPWYSTGHPHSYEVRKIAAAPTGRDTRRRRAPDWPNAIRDLVEPFTLSSPLREQASGDYDLVHCALQGGAGTALGRLLLVRSHSARRSGVQVSISFSGALAGEIAKLQENILRRWPGADRNPSEYALLTDGRPRRSRVATDDGPGFVRNALDQWLAELARCEADFRSGDHEDRFLLCQSALVGIAGALHDLVPADVRRALETEEREFRQVRARHGPLEWWLGGPEKLAPAECRALERHVPSMGRRGLFPFLDWLRSRQRSARIALVREFCRSAPEPARGPRAVTLWRTAVQSCLTTLAKAPTALPRGAPFERLLARFPALADVAPESRGRLPYRFTFREAHRLRAAIAQDRSLGILCTIASSEPKLTSALAVLRSARRRLRTDILAGLKRARHFAQLRR